MRRGERRHEIVRAEIGEDVVMGDQRDIAPDGKSCQQVWASPEASQSVVPKMSSQTGLIYIYTREAVPGFDAKKDAAYAWYLTALDYRSGKLPSKC